MFALAPSCRGIQSKPLPLSLDAREAKPLAWPLPAWGAEPPPLPSGEARALAWRVVWRGGVALVLLALGVVLLALGVKPGVEPGPGDVPRRSGGRVVRLEGSRLRLTTAVAAGDPFRYALAFCCALAGAFVPGLRVGMLGDVLQQEGRMTEGKDRSGA